MKAYLKNYAQSPRKVRLVANLIKGKSVADAQTELTFLVKRAALPFQKLLASAVANAKANFDMDVDTLYVAEVRVDKGIVMKRSMPRAMGRASRINKRTSHVALTLASRDASKAIAPKAKTAKKEAAPAKAEKVVKAKKPRVTKVKKA